MNKIKICIYLLIASSISITSCKKDYLEVPPNNIIPSTEFWKTSNDAIFGINSIYGQMLQGAPSNGLYGGTMFWLDVISDDAMWQGNASATGSGGWAGAANGNETALGNNSYHTRVWPAFYKIVTRANNAIVRISSISMDETLKKRLIAEAKFLRAYAYHKLTTYFGDVPLILKAPEEENPLPARAPIAEVRAQVVKDLTEAAADLPNSYPAAEVGRATKGAALTCLMAVQMYDKKWAEAATAAQQVVDLGVYQLLPKFSDLWRYGNEETRESIFEVHFGSSTGSHNSDWMEGNFPPPMGGGFGGWGGFSTPQQQLVNEFETAIDNNADGTIDVAQKFNPATITSLFDVNQYKDRDPRLAASIWFNKADYFGAPYDPSIYGVGSGYHWKKYNTAPRVAFPFGVPDYNTIIYRYAYVLLGLAESKNEATGPDASVYNAVNAVRNRAGMPSLAAGLTKDQMRDAIRHERRVEFAGENHRYEDLLRWRTLKQALETRGINNGRQGGTITFAESRYVWPIPIEEILANPNVKQNPGYN